VNSFSSPGFREREREREEEEEADEVLPTLPAVQRPKKSSLTRGVCKCFRGKKMSC